jgi:hypothetical protein
MKNQFIPVVAMLATALITAIATAQAPSSPQRILRGEEVPLTKATMYLYYGLANAKSKDAPAFRALAGLDQKTVDNYVAYVKAATETVLDSEHEQRLKVLCSRRAAITSGKQLIDALVQIDANVDAVRAKVIADSARVLGAAGKRQVDSYVLATREALTISEVDPARVVQFGTETGLSISGIVGKLCPER